MEPIVFNLFFVPFFFGICVGGEGFTFVFYVSQVNKVILGPPPCLQVLGGAWVLHVAGKKQLFLTDSLQTYVCRRVEGNTPPP